MGAPDATNIVVAGTGHIYVAPVLASTLPTDSATTLNAAWKELGFTTDDGATRTDGKTVDEIPAWQSFYPPKRLITARAGSLAFTLHEYHPDSVSLAFGGGTVTKTTTGGTRAVYTPPDPATLDFRQMLVEYFDGTDKFRFVIPRGLVTSDVESNLQRTGPLDLPITFDITPATSPTNPVSNPPTTAELGTQPWYEITNKTIFTT